MKRLLPIAFAILPLLGHGAVAVAAPLPLGAEAPAVVAITDAGTPLDLGLLCQQGLVLVYFYPKANTASCTAQGCSLRDAYADLTAAGVRVVGVSTDAVAAQKAFREKNGLPFPLISDTDQRVATVFGVPTTLGYAARQTYLFKDGKLVWRELTAPTARQAADVFEALKTLGTVRLSALCSTVTVVAAFDGAATER